MSDIFVGQTIRFEFTITDEEGGVVDISSAVLDVSFSQPSKVCFNRTPILVTDGLDGKMEYTTLVTDLTTSGDWKVQPVITIGAQIYPSSIEEFIVRSLVC